ELDVRDVVRVDLLRPVREDVEQAERHEDDRPEKDQKSRMPPVRGEGAAIDSSDGHVPRRLSSDARGIVKLRLVPSALESKIGGCSPMSRVGPLRPTRSLMQI